MHTASNDERSVRATATAVVIDGSPRTLRATAAAERLGLDVVAHGAWIWAAPSLVERFRPDLLVLACDEPVVCIRLVKHLYAVAPQTRVVVVGRVGGDAEHRRLLEAGALVVLAHVTRPPDAAAANMTARELEICSFLAGGLRNGEIAKRLWVTERTVKFHLSNIYKKLGVRSRSEAITALSGETSEV